MSNIKLKDRKVTKEWIGRQVYFKLSKKKMEESGIRNFTPNKLYTIVNIRTATLAYIIDDTGRLTLIRVTDFCAFLEGHTTWILKNAEVSSHG